MKENLKESLQFILQHPAIGSELVQHAQNLARNITLQHYSLSAETQVTDEQIILSALERMDRARNILTSGNPTPTCNWGMLDTHDLRELLAKDREVSMPELPIPFAGSDYTAAQMRDYGLKCRRALLSAPPAAETFQQRVLPWMLECFGEAIANDLTERNHRFLEEALELVQSTGCTQSEAHQLVDYVFGRPVGERSQEVGGVMVTLAALCLAAKLDMHTAGETELARINAPETVLKIRAKQAAKPKHSPLPQAAAAPQEQAPFNEADEVSKHLDGAMVPKTSPFGTELSLWGRVVKFAAMSQEQAPADRKLIEAAHDAVGVLQWYYDDAGGPLHSGLASALRRLKSSLQSQPQQVAE